MTHEKTRPLSKGGLSGGDATNVNGKRTPDGFASTDSENSAPYGGAGDE